ncbi:MAG: hypothetical protein MNPFHGCM_02321 [Gemmatimonadaceae bacterium]|nr:hypothetical protein [Gemmatimonadaceae bacterium]
MVNETWRGLATGLLLVASLACASANAPPASPSSGVSSDLITLAEIERGNFRTALQAVESLRPNMLRQRALTLRQGGTGNRMATSASDARVPVVAYVDDVRVGDASRLAEIPAVTVREIRYVNAREATTRWGTNHASGAILVYTKR